MKRFILGVIGNPIEHSLSPQIHQHFAEQVGISLEFKKIACEAEDFSSTLADFKDKGGSGISVTIPFKQEALKVAANRSQRAIDCTASNSLKWENDAWSAENTDGIGLLSDLQSYNMTDWKAKRVLVVGAGGAARGIVQAFAGKSLAMLVIVNRTFKNAGILAQDFAPQFPDENLWFAEHAGSCSKYYDICINASASSMSGEVPELLRESAALSRFVYDIFYDKRGITPLTQYCKQRGIENTDGIGMLVQQAYHSFKWWTGISPDVSETIKWMQDKND